MTTKHFDLSYDNLKRMIENPTSEEEDFLNQCFSDLYEIDLNNLADCPYWIEAYYNQDENYQVQYVSGYWEPKKYGDILTIEGKKYLYVDSQNLSEEIEHEAENGGLLYENRGYSYLRILKPLD